MIIICVGLFLISSIFSSGWYAAHDGIFHIYRTEEALNMLKEGQFPLRWAGNFDQGFGIPLFTFVYPLPYYITAILSYFTSSIWAVKILTIFAYLSGGIGIFQIFKKNGSLIAITLSLVYLMTPYQFLNIFVRGALGEILALGIMPWVLYGFNHLSSVKKLAWFHPIPLALLLVAHNFLGILFTVFLVVYVLLDKKNRSKTTASILLSISLAAFFLIPMILQKNLLYSADHPDLNFRFDQHFVTAKQLIYSKWDYWYSMPGEMDGMSFQLGIAQLLLAVIGSIYIISKRRHAYKELFLVAAYLGSIFLMHAKSFPIWQNISILQSIQFPWRFLFMPAILTPLIIFPLLQSLSKKKYLIYILLVILTINFINVRNYRRPIKFLDLTEYTDLYRLYYNKTSTTFRTEILPKWSVPNERFKSEELLVNSGNMTIDSIEFDPLSLTIVINNKPDESKGKITILRNYYPGWIAIMDNQTKLNLTPTSEGMIHLFPEIGVHTYYIKITSTRLEQIANIISLAGLISLVYLKSKKPIYST